MEMCSSYRERISKSIMGVEGLIMVMFYKDFSSRSFETIPNMIAIVYDYKLKENYDDVHDHDQKPQNVLAAKLQVYKSSVLQATLVSLMCVRYVKKVAQSGNN